ncbi:hypothetical protein Tco_1249885, partial [Tanacetum coccineum]
MMYSGSSGGKSNPGGKVRQAREQDVPIGDSIFVWNDQRANNGVYADAGG